MRKTSEILSGIPSFSALSESQLEEIEQIVVNRTFHKGEFIFSQGDKSEGFYIVSLNITKVQLSSLLGTSPETLSRILAQMVDRGFIKVKKSDIRILNHTGLKELAVHGKIIE